MCNRNVRAQTSSNRAVLCSFSDDLNFYRNASRMKPAITDEIMDAQADLQTALGIYRLNVQEKITNPKFNGHVEDRMARCLARLHRLLDQLGKPMYQPAQHPDIEYESKKDQ